MSTPYWPTPLPAAPPGLPSEDGAEQPRLASGETSGARQAAMVPAVIIKVELMWSTGGESDREFDYNFLESGHLHFYFEIRSTHTATHRRPHNPITLSEDHSGALLASCQRPCSWGRCRPCVSSSPPAARAVPG